MKWQILSSLSLGSPLVGTALGYGTTISIGVSYCPATYTTSTTSTSSMKASSPTSSHGPDEPFYLSFLVDSLLPRRAEKRATSSRRYIAADGIVTEDPQAAAIFAITTSGQLMNSGDYISTTGLVQSQLFEATPELKDISTRFAVRSNDTLTWENDAFVGGEAIFCLLGDLFVTFNGTSPFGCTRTYLEIIPVDEVTMPPTPTFTTSLADSTITTSIISVTTYPPGTVYGKLVYGIPLGCLSSPLDDPALLGPNTFVSNLEQCADYCFDFNVFGVKSSNFCVCGNGLQTSDLGLCDVPCEGNATATCGGSNAFSAYEIVFRKSGSVNMASTISSFISSTPHLTSTITTPPVTASIPPSHTASTTVSGETPPSSTALTTSASEFPAPTSTGTPNCFDGAGFDGTVNSDYLILCDTELPGSDLDTVPAADLAKCIGACSSYVASSEGICVAVEFDILAEANPCHLKFNIGLVTRGGNPFAQAAIVVNLPYAPEITFSGDPGFSTTTSPSLESTTAISPIPTTTQTPPSTSLSIASTMTTMSSPLVSSTVSPTLSHPPTTTNVGVSSTGAQSSPSLSTSSPLTIQSVGSSITTQQTPLPTTIPSSVSTGGVPSTTTNAPQPSSSARPSSTVGKPTFHSTGSSLSSITTSSALSSTPGATTSSPPETSASSPMSRPPSSTSPGANSTNPQSTLSTSTSLRPSSTFLPTSSTTIPPTAVLATSTTAAPYCSGATPTAALCPAYNHQAVNVNGDGACYEIECQTNLDGTILTGNSTRTVSHNVCIGFCSLYNVAIPFGCVGVNYFGISVPGNNCVLLSSITSTRYLAGVDSGRLLYAGYPSISDPNYGTISVSSVSQTAAPTQTSLTSTATYSATSCSAGPTSPSSPLCPGSSPFCNSYNSWGTPDNFEIECATSFTGSSLQPLLAFSLADCISWCQYANAYSTSLCTGVTFREGNVTQGGQNNCFRYSSLICAIRGNSTFNSARVLNSAYPQMTDYNDPSFMCSAQASSTVGPGTSTVPDSGGSSSTSRSATTATTTSPAATVSTSRPATSTTVDLSQQTSTAFPSAFPQDPVCENNLISKFEGGQALVNPNLGRYYDIECAADYNTGINLPFGVTTQPTYNSCLDQCDQAVAANASVICAAFSWVSSTGACTLLGKTSNGRQTTTGMTNTLGTHSGRWLFNQGGSTPDGPGLQVYLQRPIPFPTGQNLIGATLPSFPGGTNTYFNGWAANSHTTPLDLSALGIQWRIFGQTSNKLFVSANFWLTTSQLELNSSSQNTWSQGGRNNDATPIAFPASNLPAYTIAPFWTQGFILMASQQGIYYQVDTISPGRYGISIEWYFSHFQIDSAVQHAIMTYDTGIPGVWTTYFFRAGSTTDDQGKRQTVGAQGGSGQSFNYCRAQTNCITPGGKLVFDTEVMDASASPTYTANYFVAANVQAGSWTWSNRPV